jgi:hypothetical protein
MLCPYLTYNTCRIATDLAGAEVYPHESACTACSERVVPHQEVNEVTVGLALTHAPTERRHAIITQHAGLLKRDKPDKHFGRLEAIKDGQGVGSQMWNLLEELGVQHTPTCPCLAWAERMNKWGPAGCRANRQAITAHMADSAKNYKWGDVAKAVAKAVQSGLAFRLSPLDPFGTLLNEAIRRAEIAAEPIDILIPLGPGSRYKNIEVRYAIRSIEKYATGWRRIYIVGTIPEFLQETDRVKLIPRGEYKHNKGTRISRKVLWVFERLPVTERVAFWNDDYLLISAVDVRTIPAYYRGTLKRDPTRGGWYRTLNGTAEALAEANLPTRHYDIHVPMILEREKFKSLGDWWRRSRKAPAMGYVMKSIYGNHFCEGVAATTRDSKMQSAWSAERIADMRARGRWLISYGDGALRAGMGQWMADEFPVASSAECP